MQVRLTVNRRAVEFEGRLSAPFAGTYIRLGRFECWLERTPHRPRSGRLMECLRSPGGSREVYAFGRRVVLDVGPR